jgi:hypothetical protein
MNKSAQILLYRIILGCPLVLVAPEHALAAPSDPDWKEFQIPDLGTRVDYPAAVFSVSDGKSEVGMGERLSTADRRASLTIYSRANETGETPASYLRKNLRRLVPGRGSANFFLGARLDQYRQKVRSLQANSRLYAVRS